ncbi:MAG: dihydropteroate synthase [Bacteroidetes bacterium]|nr:dihydropteroate synthase [Bacteroidota bacterium]
MFSLSGAGKVLVLERPVVMGIINCTPDSFYSGSRVQQIDQGLRLAEEQIRQGAMILDLGGQSTQPGSEPVAASEEIARVIPLLSEIRKEFPEVFISIDTFQAAVAQAAVDAGADMINDISGGQIDPDIRQIVARHHLPYVLMHLKGTPQTMQGMTSYADVTDAVLQYFERQIDDCQAQGIHQLILDPGIGFAKTIEQNFQLLREWDRFTNLPYPVLVGLSRKSLIYKTLDIDPLLAGNGTTALHMQALLKGTKILRAHDVRPAWETIQLFQALQTD